MSETAARRANASDAGVDTVAATLRGLCHEIRRAARDNRPGEGDPSVANMRAYLALRRLGMRSSMYDRVTTSLERSSRPAAPGSPPRDREPSRTTPA